jgi:hypothetical protein
VVNGKVGSDEWDRMGMLVAVNGKVGSDEWESW